MVRGVLRDGLKAPNMDIILLLGKESDRIVRKKPADWANERVDLVMYLWLFCGANLLPSGKDWRDLKAGDIWPELKKYWKIGEYGPGRICPQFTMFECYTPQGVAVHWQISCLWGDTSLLRFDKS